jgi:hypothetical protein
MFDPSLKRDVPFQIDPNKTLATGRISGTVIEKFSWPGQPKMADLEDQRRVPTCGERANVIVGLLLDLDEGSLAVYLGTGGDPIGSEDPEDLEECERRSARPPVDASIAPATKAAWNTSRTFANGPAAMVRCGMMVSEGIVGSQRWAVDVGKASGVVVQGPLPPPFVAAELKAKEQRVWSQPKWAAHAKKAWGIWSEDEDEDSD